MANQLEQRQIWSKITYTLEYNGIRAHDHGFNRNVTHFVRFEDIQPTPFFLRVFHKAAIILAMFCGVWLLVFLLGVFSPGFNPINYGIMLFLALVPAAALWFSRTEVIGYGTPGNGLILSANKPSRAVVEAFLAAMQEARISYLRDVYLEHAASATPDEELRRLIWLKDVGVLTGEELEERRKALFPIQSSNGIGFHLRESSSP